MLATNRDAGTGFSATNGVPKIALLGGISTSGDIKSLQSRQEDHVVRRLGLTRPVARLICEKTCQIAENVTGSFVILAEWSLAERLTAVHDDNAQVTPKGSEAGHDR